MQFVIKLNDKSSDISLKFEPIDLSTVRSIAYYVWDKQQQQQQRMQNANTFPLRFDCCIDMQIDCQIVVIVAVIVLVVVVVAVFITAVVVVGGGAATVSPSPLISAGGSPKSGSRRCDLGFETATAAPKNTSSSTEEQFALEIP